MRNESRVTTLGIMCDISPLQTAHQLAGGEKDIAVYLIANEKAVPFYEKCGMKPLKIVMEDLF